MRKLIALVVLGATLVVALAVAQAAPPPGPRLAFVRTELATDVHPHRVDILTSGPGGGSRQVVTGDLVPNGIEPSALIAWSPDGEMLAFGGVKRDGAGALDLYLVGSDGSGFRRLTDLGDADGPVFSSDGRTVFFFRVKYFRGSVPATSIWAIDSDGTGLRQVTAVQRKRFLFPASVSPAGDLLGISSAKCGGSSFEIRCRSAAKLVSLASGEQHLLARRSYSPVFSPDGSRIALLSYRGRPRRTRLGGNHTTPPLDLYVLDRSSGTMDRLTRSKSFWETSASWDPSGTRIAFTREDVDADSAILTANADGSCKKVLFGGPLGRGTTVPRLYYSPTWQPGLGRGAGRIAC